VSIRLRLDKCHLIIVWMRAAGARVCFIGQGLLWYVPTQAIIRWSVMSTILGLLAVFALVYRRILRRGGFSLVGARRTRLARLAGRRRARIARMKRYLDNYIAATQLGITLASLGLGWIGNPPLAIF
jgi:hypothetical protein